MSIDSFFFVPAGVRSTEPGKRGYRKYKSFADFKAAHPPTHHQVKWVAGGWIDEQYFFEDAMDARWFFAEGWRQRDFSDGGCPVGYPPTALWIYGQQRCQHCAEPLGGESFDVHCDTCGRAMEVCDNCWNNSDDCVECEDRRDEEQWCVLCDMPLVNMTPEEQQRHLASHK